MRLRRRNFDLEAAAKMAREKLAELAKAALAVGTEGVSISNSFVKLADLAGAECETKILRRGGVETCGRCGAKLVGVDERREKPGKR